uniref:CA domain-containing protein n=1 Tax=Steinernema glaseri TaxID=37863 RepID=A0A1I7ZB64_9BILA
MADLPLNLTGTTETMPQDAVSSILSLNGTLSAEDNSTSSADISSTVSSIASTTSTAASTSLASSTNDLLTPSDTSKIVEEGSPFGLIFISTILFIVAILIVGKILYSYRWKRKAQMLGSARWLPSNGSNANMGTRRGGGGAVYSAMPVNMMDTPRPESRLDWERQFFEDDVLNGGVTEEQATTPSRLELAFR